MENIKERKKQLLESLLKESRKVNINKTLQNNIPRNKVNLSQLKSDYLTIFKLLEPYVKTQITKKFTISNNNVQIFKSTGYKNFVKKALQLIDEGKAISLDFLVWGNDYSYSLKLKNPNYHQNDKIVDAKTIISILNNFKKETNDLKDIQSSQINSRDGVYISISS